MTFDSSVDNSLTAAYLRSVDSELQLAKHASEAPWVRKIGNQLSRENLVMTSAYERPSIRTSVRTRGEREGRLQIFLTVTHTGN